MRDFKVLILGAGMSGILAGIKLKAAGINNFDIIEKASEVGGTWQANTYPGLACDVPAHTYDYSFEPNWKWSGLYAKGPELFAYFKHCADKYGLRPHLRLNTTVTEIARRDGHWQVSTEDGATHTGDAVINCMGFLCHPSMPDIPGLGDFAGHTFHSARWDHSVALDGKKIGVIGTGSTATQITVALAKRASQLNLFQRTPQWVMPAFQTRRPKWMQSLHRRVPGLSTATGKAQGKLIEKIGDAMTGDSPATAAIIRQLCYRHLNSVKDPVLRQKLTPDYKVGCRRLVFSDDFYDAIQAPQANLITSGIEHIEAGGIQTRDGQLHELDVLVLATGFHALNYTYGFEVINEQGDKLSEQWADGSDALRGVAVNGFPNYFMLVGPRSPVGNFSITGIAESQMNYLMPLLEQLRLGKANEINVCPRAQERYNQTLQDGLGKTVWTSGCNSGWYLDKKGRPQLYPFTPRVFRRDMRAPDFSEYVINKT